jgi:hypothetical protein
MKQDLFVSKTWRTKEPGSKDGSQSKMQMRYFHLYSKLIKVFILTSTGIIVLNNLFATKMDFVLCNFYFTKNHENRSPRG